MVHCALLHKTSNQCLENLEYLINLGIPISQNSPLQIPNCLLLPMNHIPSAYLKLNDQDSLDDKLATGQHAIRRHSPIPVDPLSGVYTGLSEDEKGS